MLNLRETISTLARNRAKWDEMMGVRQARPPSPDLARRHLTETHEFGTNPGDLRMFSYVPARLPARPALLVVLHGCKQSAASYDLGAGWSTLAERYGFVLLLPEQRRANNPNRCFNWFLPGDTERGQGEALSIRQMVEKAAIDHGVDPSRVFVTGLSAGGAMTSVMLACYPDVFAGGAIIAGLPYGAAGNVQQAFESMFQSPARPADAWGDLVRRASPHTGPWPRISVWHGDADQTVIPENAGEILKQWTNVHGLPGAPSGRAIVDGHPREVWSNAAGDELIESYTIAEMPHGTPLATGDGDSACGMAGPFLLEVGISSSYHIARFFGLTRGTRFWERREETAAARPAEPDAEAPAAAAESPALEGEILNGAHAGREERHRASPGIDIGGVIKKALKTAGLIKER